MVKLYSPEQELQVIASAIDCAQDIIKLRYFILTICSKKKYEGIMRMSDYFNESQREMLANFLHHFEDIDITKEILSLLKHQPGQKFNSKEISFQIRDILMRHPEVIEQLSTILRPIQNLVTQWQQYVEHLEELAKKILNLSQLLNAIFFNKEFNEWGAKVLGPLNLCMVNFSKIYINAFVDDFREGQFTFLKDYAFRRDNKVQILNELRLFLQTHFAASTFFYSQIDTLRASAVAWLNYKAIKDSKPTQFSKILSSHKSLFLGTMNKAHLDAWKLFLGKSESGSAFLKELKEKMKEIHTLFDSPVALDTRFPISFTPSPLANFINIFLDDKSPEGMPDKQCRKIDIFLVLNLNIYDFFKENGEFFDIAQEEWNRFQRYQNKLINAKAPKFQRSLWPSGETTQGNMATFGRDTAMSLSPCRG